MTEPSDNLIARLDRMAENRHDYDIGHWWNAVDEALEALAERDAEIARLRGELDAAEQHVRILRAENKELQHEAREAANDASAGARHRSAHPEEPYGTY